LGVVDGTGEATYSSIILLMGVATHIRLIVVEGAVWVIANRVAKAVTSCSNPVGIAQDPDP